MRVRIARAMAGVMAIVGWRARSQRPEVRRNGVRTPSVRKDDAGDCDACVPGDGEDGSRRVSTGQHLNKGRNASARHRPTHRSLTVRCRATRDAVVP